MAQSEGETCLLVNLLGEQRLVRGRIEKIDFLQHAIYLRRARSRELNALPYDNCIPRIPKRYERLFPVEAGLLEWPFVCLFAAELAPCAVNY